MKFGREMNISINVKTKIQCDKLCQHFVEIKKPSPSTWASTTSILHRKERSQRQWRACDMNTNGSINKDKGMQTQVYGNGGEFCYSFLTLKISPPPMLHNGSIYSPQMGNGGSNRSVSRHMEGQGSSYLLLDEENSKYFLFRAQTLCMWVVMVQAACTRDAKMFTHVYIQNYLF